MARGAAREEKAPRQVERAAAGPAPQRAPPAMLRCEGHVELAAVRERALAAPPSGPRAHTLRTARALPDGQLAARHGASRRLGTPAMRRLRHPQQPS
eukprot:6081300-Prymnesium_polylepis.1